VPETSANAQNPFGCSGGRGSNYTGNKSISFDWVPPDVPEDVVSYMQLKRCDRHENNLSLMESV
jgi:hypothetical protein